MELDEKKYLYYLIIIPILGLTKPIINAKSATQIIINLTIDLKTDLSGLNLLINDIVPNSCCFFFFQYKLYTKSSTKIGIIIK